MKSTETGAQLSTRELTAIQVVLEQAIEGFTSTIRCDTHACSYSDETAIAETTPLLRKARRLWRAIENTHISRQASPPKEEQMSKTREIMSVKQAAEYLGVHVNTVEKLLRSGEMPAFKLGKLWRMKRSVIDSWVMKKMQAGSAR